MHGGHSNRIKYSLINIPNYTRQLEERLRDRADPVPKGELTEKEENLIERASRY